MKSIFVFLIVCAAVLVVGKYLMVYDYKESVLSKKPAKDCIYWDNCYIPYAPRVCPCVCVLQLGIMCWTVCRWVCPPGQPEYYMCMDLYIYLLLIQLQFVLIYIRVCNGIIFFKVLVDENIMSPIYAGLKAVTVCLTYRERLFNLQRAIILFDSKLAIISLN